MRHILGWLTQRGALKLVLYFFLVGGFFGGAGVALAGQAESPYYYYGPVSGYDYKNIATIVTETSPLNGAWAFTEVYQNGYLSVPTGYEGVLARMYNSSGVLITESNWYYNTAPSNGIGMDTSPYTGHGTYYSYGISAAYNGNGYNYYYTFKSPNQNY